MNPEELNGSNLAFVGDAVLSLCVRTWLLEQGYTRAGELHRRSVEYVRATAQARFMQTLLQEEALTAQELEIYKRGRNSHGASRAKHADVVTYRVATGLEALLGFWHLSRNQERLAWAWQRMKAVLEEPQPSRTAGEGAAPSAPTA